MFLVVHVADRSIAAELYSAIVELIGDVPGFQIADVYVYLLAAGILTMLIFAFRGMHACCCSRRKVTTIIHTNSDSRHAPGDSPRAIRSEINKSSYEVV